MRNVTSTTLRTVVGVLSGLVAATGASDASPIPFAAHLDYATGERPGGIALADLDGDGDLDVVTANPVLSFGGEHVSVLLNAGDGTLAAPLTLDPLGPASLAEVGDVDGDGDPDIVAALSGGTETIAVFLNDGTATFSPAVRYGTYTAGPGRLLLRDIDGDADVDALIASAGIGEIAVLRNLGGGAFADAALSAYATQAYTADAAVADLDGDSDVDVVAVAALSSEPPAILWNQGDGTFGTPQPFSTVLAGVFSVGAGDVDADGDQDLVVLAGSFGQNIQVHRNDGAGNFGAAETYATAASVSVGTRILLDDLDGDGAADLVVPWSNLPSVAVHGNDGSGAFETAVAHVTGDRPVYVASGDLDGDGIRDLVTTNLLDDTVSILLGQAGSATAAPLPSPRSGIRLGAGRPNPTSSLTSLPFRLDRTSHVSMSVHDVSGKLIRQLVDDTRHEGSHVVTWDGRGASGDPMPAGVYLVRVQAGDVTSTRKLVRVR